MKRPWMPLYVSDFINSEEVIDMPPEACGVYIKLLCFNWEAGDLPADPDRLAKMVRMNPRSFRRLWPIIQHLFPEHSPGRLGNYRVMKELKDADKKVEQSRKAAEKRWSGHADPLPTDQIRSDHNTTHQSNIYTPPLVPAGVDLGKPENKTQAAIVDRFVLVALPIFDALNAARKRAIPGARDMRPTYASLAGICGRLDAGKTATDCLAVIEACEAECKRDQQSAKWFDAISPWRPENFERKLAASGIEIDRYSGFRAPMKHQAETKDETDDL